VDPVGRIVFDTATTLNGYIADEADSLEWLFAVDGGGMPEDHLVPTEATVLVEGSTTYQWVLDHEDLLEHPEKWPELFHGDRPSFVFTTRELPAPAGADVRFVSGPVADALPEIRAAAGDGDIWVVGGGDLAGQFLDAGPLCAAAPHCCRATSVRIGCGWFRPAPTASSPAWSMRSPVRPTMTAMGDTPFDPTLWRSVEGFQDLTDITYHRHVVDDVAQPTVRVAFNRPEVRNAFRPHTVDELYRALDHARMSPDVGVVLLTGNGPSPRDGGWAFCSGGDQRIRGRSGYQYAAGETADTVDVAQAGRLHILEVQRLIRFMPKPVICLVNGWAAGGGHSLHVVCDLTLASREHARFKQTDADVGSFDGGYGSAYLARQVGQKFAREIFFLGEAYTAEEMHKMGAVNRVVDHAELETVALQWAATINGKSPQAQRMLKFAFNLLDDGLVGQQIFAGEATRLAYMTDEAVEGRDAFLEKRDPDWSSFPRYF
jgi:naphthoate synthase